MLFNTKTKEKKREKNKDKKESYNLNNNEENINISESQQVKDPKDLDNKIEKIEQLGTLEKYEDLKIVIDKEIDETYSDIKYWEHEYEYYSDPELGNDEERANDALDEIHSKENYLEDLYKISNRYGIEVEHNKYENSTNLNNSPELVNKSKNQNFFQKAAKRFRNIAGKNLKRGKGGYSR